MTTLNQFEHGQRVQTQPWTDMWMRGGTHGTVVKVGRVYVHVAIDRAGGKVYKFRPENLKP